MGKQEPANHGEGNPEAAERFNAAETGFVHSERGRKKIEEGAQVRPDEQPELDAAEAAGRRHAKDDPTATR
jgi:hypothetical protein